MSVVTRIPPSPTGRLHIGTARTALFNYLFARHHGGSVVFRSEDTDRARSKRVYEDEIIEGLDWLGLSWDAFSRQSERAKRYRELLEGLIGAGKAYRSRERSREDPAREVELVRLRNRGGPLTFRDEIRGEITTDTTELGDFVVARSADDALYQFAVVADDADSGVTHVIRGEDHISNTPRQILIQEALGVPRPVYAHLPLILDEKRAKLSKRSGATALAEYRAEGFLPEALANYLALLGWNPGDEREDFSLGELVKAFSLAGVQKSGAVFDRTKLLSVNQRWMRKLSSAAFANLVEPERPLPDGVVELLKERAHTLGEARALLADEFSYLFTLPTLSPDALLRGTSGENREKTRARLACAAQLLRALAPSPSAEETKNALMPYAEKEGRRTVLWPVRYALSGRERSPDPFTLVSILGREETVSRIEKAIAILER